MLKIIASFLFCFTLNTQYLEAQNQQSIKYKVTPNIFDSTATFSFLNSIADTVSLVIFDRWGTAVTKIILSKYFSVGEHDTTCNLSFLKPGKYLSVLLVSTAGNIFKTDSDMDKRLSFKEIITKRSPVKK